MIITSLSSTQYICILELTNIRKKKLKKQIIYHKKFGLATRHFSVALVVNFRPKNYTFTRHVPCTVHSHHSRYRVRLAAQTTHRFLICLGSSILAIIIIIIIIRIIIIIIIIMSTVWSSEEEQFNHEGR